MQLRQAEPVGVFHDHDGRVGDVDTDLDHGGRDEHVEAAIAEGGHHGLLLLRGQLPVQQPEPQPGELLGLQPFELRGRGLGLDLALLLHQRAHDVGLVAGLDLVPQALPHRDLVERLGPDHLGRDRRAAGRHLAQLRLVEVAVDEHRRGARDRRRRHHEHVGHHLGAGLRLEQRALLHAEAVLLVDHGEPELGELRVAVEERVRADEDVDLVVGEPLGDAPALGRGRAVRVST